MTADVLRLLIIQVCQWLDSLKPREPSFGKTRRSVLSKPIPVRPGQLIMTSIGPSLERLSSPGPLNRRSRGNGRFGANSRKLSPNLRAQSRTEYDGEESQPCIAQQPTVRQNRRCERLEQEFSRRPTPGGALPSIPITVREYRTLVRTTFVARPTQPPFAGQWPGGGNSRTLNPNLARPKFD